MNGLEHEARAELASTTTGKTKFLAEKHMLVSFTAEIGEIDPNRVDSKRGFAYYRIVEVGCTEGVTGGEMI